MSRVRTCTDVFWAIEPRHFRAHLVPLQSQAASPTPQAIDSGYDLDANEPGYEVCDGVAIINLEGVLGKGRSWWHDTDMNATTQAVRRAAADPNVKALVLLIDSPGGTVAGTSDLAEAVFAARKQKTVCAYASDLMASAAYYVGSQADRIYADTDAVVGSIGVYCVIPDYSAMAADMGIKMHVVKAGAMKGAATPGTKVTPEQLAEFQREINQINETFVDAVARGRGWPRAQAEKLNDGRVHVGAHAVELGLVDEIIGLEDLVKGLAAQAATGQMAASRWKH